MGKDRKALSKRVRTLERRMVYLRGRIEDPTVRERSKDWDREELEALSLALDCLKRYRAEYQLQISAVELLRGLRSKLSGLDAGGELWELLEDVDQLLTEMAA